MRTPGFALVVAALWGACGSTSDFTEHASPRPPELEAPLIAVTGTSVRNELIVASSCKSEPPVKLEIASRPLGRERFEISVIATPIKAVDRLDLEVWLPSGVADKLSFGASGQGERRMLTTVIESRERTAEISAIARIPVDGIAMTKAATVTIGEPKPVPRTRDYTLPDGERAREVRP